MKRTKFIVFISTVFLMACGNSNLVKSDSKNIRLVTLDPGHFHAALVQKTMYDDVDSVVYVYAPGGNDLQLHIEKIDAYNTRKENPTRWKEEIYTGTDFFEKMIAEKKGNVVVLSGNNQKKSDYILTSLQNGFHVYADKPMAINSEGFEKLKQAFDVAKKNNLVLYDIMTERNEITTILQRELSTVPEIFGTLQKGSAKDPAVVMESVHHFYKFVSGNVLTRPSWFFDASQQGEGIADVMTHLVDLVQWECFPEQTIDYTNDIQITSARRWTTDLGLSSFKAITKTDSFPSYLKNSVSNDTLLKIFFNGEINYSIKGVHAKTVALWNFKAPEGAGDTHYSLLKGTKANLVIRQGVEENYQSTLYIEPIDKNADPSEAFKKIQAKYPGVELKKSANGWQVVIPTKYKEGHEEHFARVTEKFLEYIKNNNMPAWEVPNMLTKYFITTRALQIASK
ncbi:MAG TPA: putative oxidoreductase C-terminal domain-containing protein [Flavisolibacter sp.]|nr:putative oxidoreductase C-terminal domain-containing protein [Flavisolibacter sp.]